MTLSIWRLAHFALALIASLFLVLASVTGGILAIDTINQEIPSYKVDNFKEIKLAKVITPLKKEFIEVTELTVSPSQYVIIKGLDTDANEVEAIINPNTGKIIGTPKKHTQWIKWVTSLHRSLFLHKTGRIILGINAFLLAVITSTGIALLLKRQNGFVGLIKKIKKDHWSSYLHVLLSRWMAIPILIMALTGAFLTLYNFKILEKDSLLNHKEIVSQKPLSQKKIEDFPIFKKVLLSDVQKLEFPFADEVEEHFTLNLKDRVILINQWNGEILSEVPISKWVRLENLSLDLHTGRGSILWSSVLLLSVFSILVFIVSGFLISYKRLRHRQTNSYTLEEGELILLVGSENGSTMKFANAIHNQFLQQGIKSFVGSMNQYQTAPNAHTILFLTSTYGDGNAPANASRFEGLIQKYKQLHTIQTAVVGFGSSQYPDFCGYAKQVETLLKKQSWNQKIIDLHTIDDQSMNDWLHWISNWNKTTTIQLSNLETTYLDKNKKKTLFKVISKSQVEGNCSNFILVLEPQKTIKVSSGDLLAIELGHSQKERLYSIGKLGDTIQLMIKLHPRGLGSNYLYQLEEGQTLKGTIVKNVKFNRPKNKKVVMIANGTGIAPFLGMIAEATSKQSLYLYAGFRAKSSFVQKIEAQIKVFKKEGRLQDFKLALSREGNQSYVTDLVNRDLDFIFQILEEEGVLMICGSLAMQKDIETLLENYALRNDTKKIDFYKSKEQILIDCY
ncbi:PepSY domain-containing protein [Flavobacterium columnare]|uniref:PepSY domain-containing protein n=1 Tax=Flavobacterium columnare TaxID=996 RepID=UPI000D1B4344|nr:PepSY domain-containing protein [Flavobacterium columnare]MBF6658425.1 FAD-binding oxidoreductase [Flavobacterium columnare]PTD14864.1 FAD-binding oxidoreductase [Flavobacterium columnare]